jgi:Ca-activated chloride channel family protein
MNTRLPALLLLAASLLACNGGPMQSERAMTAAGLVHLDEGELPLEGRYRQDFNTEEYDQIVENAFLDAARNPLSTFAADVDTASYANVRRFLLQGDRPPRDAVRIEELVNYFDYGYEGPRDATPFAVHTVVGACPWAPSHRLVRIGLQARRIDEGQLPPRNLVFLLDVSGSMNDALKLPLVKRSMKLLVEKLGSRDRVAIAVYAGASGLVLPPTAGDRRTGILEALDKLEAGGSTNGGEGIELAYRTARESFSPQAVNRVILATDGDFNIGVTNQGDLVRLIEKEREGGIFLTVLGFGMGNLKDTTMEKLADKGNGNYAYIDNIAEARKVLVTEAGGTLVTVAKDVKLQVEWNPARVGAYRLIGYENRLLRAEEFNDDTRDAGEMGAGHSVTALYEITPPGEKVEGTGVDPLRYQRPTEGTEAAAGGELLHLKVRYKEPAGSESRLLTFPVADRTAEAPSEDYRFAASVAAFGMLLRDSTHKGSATFDMVQSLARGALGSDAQGYRAEFLRLIALARDL